MWCSGCVCHLTVWMAGHACAVLRFVCCGVRADGRSVKRLCRCAEGGSNVDSVCEIKFVTSESCNMCVSVVE